MNEEIRQSIESDQGQTDRQEILDWYKENQLNREETCNIIFTKENPERIRFKNRSIEEAIFHTFTADSYL